MRSHSTPRGPVVGESGVVCGCRYVVLGVSEIRNSEVCNKAVFRLSSQPRGTGGGALSEAVSELMQRKLTAH